MWTRVSPCLLTLKVPFAELRLSRASSRRRAALGRPPRLLRTRTGRHHVPSPPAPRHGLQACCEPERCAGADDGRCTSTFYFIFHVGFDTSCALILGTRTRTRSLSRRLDSEAAMDTRASKRRGGGSGSGGGDDAAVGAGVGGRTVSLVGRGAGGGGGRFALPSDGPLDHLSPGYGAGYDAGFQAGLRAASHDVDSPPPPLLINEAVAVEGGAGPARPPLLALVEDLPDLFHKEVLERRRPRAARAHGGLGPHRGESIGPAARRRQRGGAAGRNRAVLRDPLDIRLGRGERLPVATSGNVQNSRRGREPGGAAMGAGERLPVGHGYVFVRRFVRAHGGIEAGAYTRPLLSST